MAKGELLKAWRIGHALSQAEFAQRAGVDVRTIRRAESGEPIDDSSALRIATVIKESDNDQRDVSSIVRERTDFDATKELLEARVSAGITFQLRGNVRVRGKVQ